MSDNIWHIDGDDITFECIRSDEIIDVIKNNKDILKSMGIKRVIGASCVGDVDNYEDTLIIGTVVRGREVKKKVIYLPIYVRPFVGDSIYSDAHINIESAYDYTTIAKMYTDKNVIVLPYMDLYSSEVNEATIFVRILLTLLKFEKEGKNINDFIYYPGYEILWIAKTFRPELAMPKIDTSKCSGRLIINNDGITYRKTFEVTIEKYYDHIAQTIIYISVPAVFRGTLTLYYNHHGRFYEVYVDDANLMISDVELNHPNVADDGKVCLGTYVPNDIDMTSDLCEQFDNIANQIIELLKMPTTNAYNNDLFEYVHRNKLIVREEKVFTSQT